MVQHRSSQRLIKLRTTAPPWWDVPKESLDAADAFDRRHDTCFASADLKLTALRKAPSSPTCDDRFQHATFLLTTNRFFVQEKPPQAAAAILGLPRPAAIKPFDLRNSIWSPREFWCDAHDFYDTDDVERARFEADAGRLLQLGLERVVCMYDDDDAAADADGDGLPDEVEDVLDVLWQHHDVIFQLFSYYAALKGRVHTINLNEWSLLCDDFGLVKKRSKTASRAHLDRVFIQANTMTERAQKQHATVVDRHDSRLELSRHEFYAALVRTAICVYVTPKVHVDVSEALHHLLSQDLHGQAIASGSHVCLDPNSFRERHCYTRAMEAVLRPAEASLRNLFGALSSQGDRDMAVAYKGLLSVEEWIGFVRAVNLLGRDLSLRDATLCFSWSRMAVINSSSRRGYDKENSLPFEGWLEALARLSALKVLPTEEELSAAGCDSCAIFFERLHNGESLSTPSREEGLAVTEATTEAAWHKLVPSRALPWGVEPTRPVAESVQHLLSMVFHRIEHATKGKDDQTITAKEAQKWASSAMAAVMA